MKIGVLIPTRNDRPGFIQNCLRMLKNQTVEPDIVNIVAHKPKSEDCDISERYRIGYNFFNDRDVDVIALIEDDDWYSPRYFERMLSEWEKFGCPDIFGTNYTIYYHLKLKRYMRWQHMERASAMNTFIKPRLKELQSPSWWPPDNEPYTDLHLWRHLKGHVIDPGEILSIGIKHGVGLTGGHMHSSRLHRYEGPKSFAEINKDYPKGFLKTLLDHDSYEFYKQFS